MNANSRKLLAAAASLLLVASAAAKLPAPSDEAKAKAAEAAAKTAHGNKVANYQLCMSMDKVAAGYTASAKQAGKEVKPATATPACENPGPFVYTPPAPAVPAASAAAAVAPAAPAAPLK
jgi:hypothetical protein